MPGVLVYCSEVGCACAEVVPASARCLSSHMPASDRHVSCKLCFLSVHYLPPFLKIINKYFSFRARDLRQPCAIACPVFWPFFWRFARYQRTETNTLLELSFLYIMIVAAPTASVLFLSLLCLFILWFQRWVIPNIYVNNIFLYVLTLIL